ncbi:MYCBP-associated protein [Sorex fumeus]|uniref:MYCBP-associated protein n=1 Tax=Sorex fumeus TaxID=62283 RepID=UPI0024AD02D4|nr:MYCBP-associated protein [Sorex fumeus]
MKSLKKESRLRIPTSSKLPELLENAKGLALAAAPGASQGLGCGLEAAPQDKKRAKVPEQPTPPIQEEPEPVSNILQGDDILALAIKKEDLKKQHVPRLKEQEGKAVITQHLLIRKHRPRDVRREVCHLVAHPATPDAAAKLLDYSGPANSFQGSEQILPHHILGCLSDFKRIALARGNTQLAELIHIPPCELNLSSTKDELKDRSPKEEKAHLPLQHNFLKNWQRNLALRKKQQEALSERLKKPVGELLMHSGETYRRIQEERELLDRALPTEHDGKVTQESRGFWSRLENLGDEVTGLVMTKTKTQRGLLEPITHVRKPHSIQVETGLLGQQEAWYRYTWDRSLFLIYRRKELQSIMEELDFSQQDIEGLEVVGKGRPLSTVTVENYSVVEESKRSTSEATTLLDLLANDVDCDVESMPILGPSLLFCGKPACWIRENSSEEKVQVGIEVRLTFETIEGQKTSSELTVVNNGTVVIWYNWQRRSQLDAFRDMKRNRVQQFYFDNREGVILPEETKTFTFFFKSSDAGIFRECWEFATHPVLLGGALLLVNLHAISLTQDLFREGRISLQKKLATQEANTVVESVMQELLQGILTPERPSSPVDSYLTEEEVFRYKNPQLCYQYQVVQSLQELWCRYAPVMAKSKELSQNLEPTLPLKCTPSAHHGRRQEPNVLKVVDASFGPIKSKASTRKSPWKKIMEGVLEEEDLQLQSMRRGSLPEWNLSLKDFREIMMALPEEHQREDALIGLNKMTSELCKGPKQLQSDFRHQMGLYLWRDLIDSLVSHALWLRSLLGLPEKETIYLDVPEEHGQVLRSHATMSVLEGKVSSGRAMKEDRKGTAQERKQLGTREREDKKGTKSPAKDTRQDLQDRFNSKKHKAKDDKKPLKSVSRDRVYQAHYSTGPSQEPTDPLVMEKYTHRLYTEVYGLLEDLLTDLMAMADELGPITNVEETLRLCT